VLVRPDGYVAWRMQDTPEQGFDHLACLTQVFGEIQLNL